MATKDRVETGIPGLDDLLEGGFPRGRTILVTGGAGTGKTIFGMQFIYHGAKLGEPGVYLTLEERPKSLREELLKFGMDLQAMEKAGRIVILDASIVRLGLESDEKFVISPENFDLNHLIHNIIAAARSINAKRVVIDALPALEIMLGEDKHKVRNAILELTYLMQESGLTTVLISEIPSGTDAISRYGVEEFVVDGVILLSKVEALDTRTLLVHKMRQTKHQLKPVTMKIDLSGLSVK